MSKVVLSPCVGLCAMDASGLLCKGCLRSMREVSSWRDLSEAERMDVRRRLARVRSAAASEHLSAEHVSMLLPLASSVRLRTQADPPSAAHEVLRRLVAKGLAPPWGSVHDAQRLLNDINDAALRLARSACRPKRLARRSGPASGGG